MRSKKVRAAMIAAAACLSFTSVVAPSATALAAGYTGLAQEANGNWYYYNNGQKVTSGTNLVQNEYGWWYVKNGQIDFAYTGLAQNEYGWWYVRNGKIDFSYTGLAQNEYGWWRIVNGMVDFG